MATYNDISTKQSMPTNDQSVTGDLRKLSAWLHQNAPSNVLIPLVSKRPMYPHSKGQWCWEDFDKFMSARESDNNVPIGLLMRDLFCVDIDNHGLCQYMRETYPAWFDPKPAEAVTSKGRHYIWRRKTGDWASDLTDRARSLLPSCIPAEFLDDNGEAPIDIKTVTSTGTSGVLVVSPSPGKKWIVAPWELESLGEVPDELLDWLENGQKRRERNKKRDRPDSAVEETDNNWDLSLDLHLAVPLAKEIVSASLGDHESVYYQQKLNGLYFRTTQTRTCPYGQMHTSNNFALVFRKDGAIMYWCFGSACQQHYHRRPEEVGRWASGATIPMHLVFDEAWYSSYATPVDAEMAKKPQLRDYDLIEENSQKLIPYLNRFFIVVKSSKPEVVELRYKDGSFDQIIGYTRRSTMQHNALYRNKKFMLNTWFAHPERRCVNRLVFEIDNSKVSATDFNMFLGLRIEREHDIAATDFDEAKIAPVLELLHDVWAGGDEYVYNYILNWFAYPLQLKRKTGVCLVVISEQGYGKGTIAHDLVGAGIYGECLYDTQDGCYTQITDIEDIVGKFNTQSCNKLFINADECSSFGGAYKQNNKLKSLITATSRKLEAKGLDAINVTDFANYLLTTNNDDPVRVETSDRRFVVLDIKREHRKSVKFFKQLHQCIEQGGPLHFYKYLMTKVVIAKDFDPQIHRPITLAAREMMAGQVPSALVFIQECADMKKLFIDDREADMAIYNQPLVWEAVVKVKSSALYGGYSTWFDRRGSDSGRKFDVGQFSKLLKKHIDAVSFRSEDGSRALELPSPQKVIATMRLAHLYVD